MAVTVKKTVFWGVTPYSEVCVCQNTWHHIQKDRT